MNFLKIKCLSFIKLCNKIFAWIHEIVLMKLLVPGKNL